MVPLETATKQRIPATDFDLSAFDSQPMSGFRNKIPTSSLLTFAEL
jgi:hypothetical protein